ncbi:MAG: formimidoylglutamase [Bdellovibrionales bacterium]|nr:formimidoylglutamase [Bdellovibrionales bacterium]
MNTITDPVNKELLFKGRTEDDPRLGKFVSEGDASTPFALIGYTDDEGISLNNGRLGAHSAPNEIRKFLYKMSPNKNISGSFINDLGNLKKLSGIEERHQKARGTVAEIHKLKAQRVISLGGGHDYGYVDGCGFLDALSDKNPIVINIDAHLDVRDLEFGPNSGTSFYRIRNEFPKAQIFQIGMQDQCNSLHHFRWCEENQILVLRWNDLVNSTSKLSAMLEFLGEELLKKRPAFLSIDMDAFSSAYAPGCSQVFPTGFAPDEILQFVEILCYRFDVRHLGLYEVSPPFDLDGRTSKLAALLAHKFLMSSVHTSDQ